MRNVVGSHSCYFGEDFGIITLINDNVDVSFRFRVEDWYSFCSGSRLRITRQTLVDFSGYLLDNGLWMCFF